MFNNSGKTAILIFTRTASGEAAVKSFHAVAGKPGNTLIARYLIRRTSRTARLTNLPVFLHYDRNAGKATFGERLADAIESVWQRGFSRVVAIGNDSPELTPGILHKTLVLLQEGKLVLGPAADGGLYLIGFSKDQYHREQFVQLSWQTQNLQNDWTSAYPAAPAATVWLEELHDIDQATDFGQLLHRMFRLDAFAQVMHAILAAFRRRPAFMPRRVRIFSAVPAVSRLRGPPQ